jgi:hypothetical protein
LVIPEAIGIVEMLRLVLGLCTAKVAEAGVTDEYELLAELDVFEVIKDKTSIVFVVVTGCGEEVERRIEAVIVVEATVAGEFAAFTGGPGRTTARGRTGAVGGDARTSSGRVKIPKIAVPIPRMSRI